MFSLFFYFPQAASRNASHAMGSIGRDLAAPGGGVCYRVKVKKREALRPFSRSLERPDSDPRPQ